MLYVTMFIVIYSFSSMTFSSSLFLIYFVIILKQVIFLIQTFSHSYSSIEILPFKIWRNYICFYSTSFYYFLYASITISISAYFQFRFRQILLIAFSSPLLSASRSCFHSAITFYYWSKNLLFTCFSFSFSYNVLTSSHCIHFLK